jgi:hypothetical protein
MFEPFDYIRIQPAKTLRLTYKRLLAGEALPLSRNFY